MINIFFNDWQISARYNRAPQQADHLSRRVALSGLLPAEWTWKLLLKFGTNVDIIPLEEENGVFAATLTRDNLPFKGNYTVQIKGECGELDRHTNQTVMFVGETISGDAHWPTLPTEFTQAESRILAAANRAESAAIHQPTIIDSTWWIWNPETGVYEDTGEGASAFAVTINTDTMTADKTSAEIYAAYTAGMSVHAIVPEQNLSLPLVRCSEDVAEFYAVTGGNAQFNVLTIYGSEVGIMGGAVNPETPDEEYVRMLIDTDMLPAVYNADGAILTDENGNVILRY